MWMHIFAHAYIYVIIFFTPLIHSCVTVHNNVDKYALVKPVIITDGWDIMMRLSVYFRSETSHPKIFTDSPLKC